MMIYQNYIKSRSHLFLHCRNCDGLFLYEGILKNPNISNVKCNHCRSYYISTSNPRFLTDEVTISRFVIAVVQKEESMLNALALLQKHKNGMSKKELEGKGFRMKYVHQLMHVGLVRQTTNSSFHITGRGFKVLEACKRY